jgi:hypothetical protein
MVPVNSVGKDGRSVKCAKCANTWFIKPSPEEINQIKDFVDPSKIAAIHDQRKLPAIHNRKISFIFKVIPLSLIGVIFILTVIFYKNVMTIVPGVENLYKFAGIFPTENVVFSNYAIRKLDSNRGRSLIFKGHIFNDSSENKIVPCIRIVIYDDKGRIIKNYTEPAKKILIAPGDYYEVSFTISPLLESAKTLKLDLGNKLDLFLKS